MTNQNQPENQNEPENMLYMWIAVAVVVVLIIGGMGINMLIHHDTSAPPTEMIPPK
jgi:hypothetical protein